MKAEEKEKSNIDVDKMLEAYKQQLLMTETKTVRPMSQEEIKKEGAEDADPYKIWKERYINSRGK